MLWRLHGALPPSLQHPTMFGKLKIGFDLHNSLNFQDQSIGRHDDSRWQLK